MKKRIAVLCALLLICFAAAASAVTVSPETPESFRTLVGGKTFYARTSGWGSAGEGEDARYTIRITVCEENQFNAAAVESLAAGDEIRFEDGTETTVTEVSADEFGITVTGSNDDAYSFYKLENGSYSARTETEYAFWTDIFTVEVPLEKDISFLDWSDPENLEAPVKLGFDELLQHLQDDTNFAPYNTRVTFDENGKLAEFLYTYSPWN